MDLAQLKTTHLSNTSYRKLIMEGFEAIPDELKALLSQHFQVVATHSQRQDQWYKRSYQSFAAEHGNREPLIIVPRESREEWVPHVRRFAKTLAAKVVAAGEAQTSRPRDITSDSKLFSDTVLDAIHSVPLSRAVKGREQLRPVAMQITRWTSTNSYVFSGTERITGIKGLIAIGEVDVLLRLATLPQTNPPKEREIDPSRWRHLNRDWQDVIDAILSILWFLGAMESFREDFVSEDGYKYWVPIAFHSYLSRFQSYIEAHDGKLPSTNEAIQKEISQCMKALVAAQVFSSKAAFDPIQWEDRIMDSFLYILGFEAWNRSREGAGYLNCDLNVTKTAKSLRSISRGDGDNNVVEEMADVKKRSATKPRDPLKLREPKKEMAPEVDDDEEQEMEKLAVIETNEKDYGRKRSMKYLTKHKDRSIG
ncbi:uncharacterized protein FFB20_12585 [Fusarium fujikuroi]|uniref:Uncharacterized protein n=2 Tax=Fusarium fujikuroi TaxID=5127 RepID=S0E735_GIBF5|nr:uncharacterized protein FFUJ_06458 [Fusarium fujikuroi IMI 58289]SCN81427.1 uncharacterized protein FFE2_04599 [Fusarium fujikuroi]CCT70480.1 uncharacterized protein FFUJ_06458 [Fusarium fujikuroi IMI 58289]SCN83878.1 uncharacterized protein FFM5_03143 [Fusarium fujikuroi]SCN85846.1 uncharacterized protein FFC1_04993 [Fusarium fujikuroi]SCO06399.1 uncharacterized protein FFB20_12585 [Fusarium fujikuroi]